MFGIDPLTVSSLLILASQNIACPKHEPTKINIVPRTSEVQYDYSQSLRQLQTYKTDTVDPYGFHGKTVTQGFMKGQIQLRHSIKFGQSRSEHYNAGCVWYDEIRVELNIDPTIVIAKELYRDRCMKKAIVDHEIIHVKVDRRIVNKFAKSMGKKLFAALKSRGFSVGPIKATRISEVQNKMQTVVGQILELEYKKLGIERQEMQREVDSREEYDSVDDKCPSFEKKKKKLYDKALK